MAKSKQVPNKHLYARVSYLYQVAQYLSSLQTDSRGTLPDTNKELLVERVRVGPVDVLDGTAASHFPLDKEQPDSTYSEHVDNRTADLSQVQLGGLSLHLSSQIAPIARKSLLQVSSEIKRSLCKRCSGLMIPGQSAKIAMENKSSGMRKPWADVLVTTCQRCGMEKRIPAGRSFQDRRRDRKQKKGSATKLGS